MVKITLRIWILIIALVLALLMISPNLSPEVIIKSIDINSTAYKEGLRPGMAIQEINSIKITSVQDYSNAISKIFNGNEEVKVEILAGSQDFIFLAQEPPDLTVEEQPSSKIQTGLDLSGGARAIVRAENRSISDSEINDLVSITSERLNTFGLKDITVASAKDLEGNNFMVIEIAGAAENDISDLLESQGKFEAKIGNQTVFVGGKDKDIVDVCRNDATCAGITACAPSQEGFACNFMFTVYLSPEAAKKHANITSELPLDVGGQYLTEKLNLFVDDREIDSLLISSGLKGQETTQISIQGSGTGISQEDAVKNTREQMKKLQTVLLTGSLPYKLEILKLDTISPTLGKQFTKNIIYLGLSVFLAVSIAIFVKYRRIKVTLSVILTMFSEVFITLGIAALFRWNLDAPSIAGIIAGIGTGVNDQIIILDESLSRQDSSSSEGIKERVKRALFIIVGAFLIIIAAMIPLFWAGAGLLKGFALTTIIGVTVGILITRPAFADIIKKIGA
ncbi:MAG: hypothetical protein Q7S27_06870 [Nanoarchaeota archaeon]|nr:hypothetical protein [Nanoarchaeota archaeon]